ncbi:MAG: beta-N-acetylhexosaminidase [Treponema sp.]|nr:beta-N-acetylhexosaminidase [Treponema sp.]
MLKQCIITAMTEYSIIPRPLSVVYHPGNFHCTGIPQIVHDENPGIFLNEIQVFVGQMKNIFGGEALNGSSGSIRLLKTDIMAENSESYRLEILPDGIRLSAAAGAGIFRGLQVLRQFFLQEYSDGAVTLPCGVIEDKPRFPWRGFMLDCSRHFYSVEFIKHILDSLSLQHINIFHWHLTDDQGWRLPVRQYPLLTEIGSKRREHRLHNAFYGGFYTEVEIREIVAYAAERHIEVVPEVDLPGHTSSVLASYPGLGCTGGPYQVEDRFSIFEDVLCAGNDDIFPLAEAVFDTLAELFPSKYVHIGGDEVRFNRWRECPKCQQRLAALGLSAPAQLQSWITSRFALMLQQRGRTAIGWDEVLENTDKFPLPKDVIVMSWRGQKGGIEASARGHRVIMAPYSEGCYLDYRPIDRPEEPGQLGVNTVAQGYNMEPVTPEMDNAAASLILGGQGNLWSEIIYAGKIAEYMIFPRICAIAETLWSDRKHKNLDDFSKRLAIHQNRLDKLGVLQYRGALG